MQFKWAATDEGFLRGWHLRSEARGHCVHNVWVKFREFRAPKLVERIQKKRTFIVGKLPAITPINFFILSKRRASRIAGIAVGIAE